MADCRHFLQFLTDIAHIDVEVAALAYTPRRLVRSLKGPLDRTLAVMLESCEVMYDALNPLTCFYEKKNLAAANRGSRFVCSQ